MAHHVSLQVTSDNMAALVMVLHVKARGPGPSAVARKLALDLADAVSLPQLVAHIPNIANEICGHLSRRFDPKHSDVPWVLSAPLALASETLVPRRDSNYHKALLPGISPNINKQPVTETLTAKHSWVNSGLGLSLRVIMWYSGSDCSRFCCNGSLGVVFLGN